MSPFCSHYAELAPDEVALLMKAIWLRTISYLQDYKMESIFSTRVTLIVDYLFSVIKHFSYVML